MNINIDAAIKQMQKCSNLLSRDYRKILTDNEIKSKGSCDGCFHAPYDKQFLTCLLCKDNFRLRHNFKPEPSELDKLFTGAPVMIDSDHGFRSATFLGWENNKAKCSSGDYNQGDVRLPTVEESPVNTWFAPPLKLPRELLSLHVWVRMNKAQCSFLKGADIKSWDDVEAVMIMKDFKK